MTGTVAALIVGVLHVVFFIAETFLWGKVGPKLLGGKGIGLYDEFPDRFVEDTKAMAANQGLYNLFLGLGLIAAASDFLGEGQYTAIFLLLCIAVAGLFGAWSMKTKSLLVFQTAFALIALFFVYSNWT